MSLPGAPDVGAVILAAGASSRLGRPKQLVRYGGQSLVRGVARAALEAGCSPVIVVTGASAEQVRGELEDLDVLVEWNGAWESGMASSIRAGLDALARDAPGAGAVVLLVCDQPHVTSHVVTGLVAAYRATRCPVVASTYDASAGVPALFARAVFAELRQLAGGAGAKRVIERYATSAVLIPFPDGSVDVDTPDDLAALLAERDRPA